MKFKTRGFMKSNPDFSVDAELEAIPFKVSVSGGMTGALGEIHGRVSEIPIRLVIPFSKRRRPTVIASVGGFALNFAPIEFALNEAKAAMEGIVGAKGIRGSAKCGVKCHTEGGMDGTVTGSNATMTISLGDDDQD